MRGAVCVCARTCVCGAGHGDLLLLPAGAGGKGSAASAAPAGGGGGAAGFDGETAGFCRRCRVLEGINGDLEAEVDALCRGELRSRFGSTRTLLLVTSWCIFSDGFGRGQQVELCLCSLLSV